MILTGEIRSIWRETCPGATLHTKNLTRTDLVSNQGLRCEKPVNNHLVLDTVIRRKLNGFIVKDSVCTAQ
jgi:hypothetical protein